MMVRHRRKPSPDLKKARTFCQVLVFSGGVDRGSIFRTDYQKGNFGPKQSEFYLQDLGTGKGGRSFEALCEAEGKTCASPFSHLHWTEGLY